MKQILDWSSYKDAGMGDAYADIPKTGGDFAKAVAVCINSRQCEVATPKGLMCPSFRATSEAGLSTGGRVRLLKAALNGELGENPFQNDEELARTMDLCVACKGCKRECENEVDMAMIKVEYLAQRHLNQKIPLRTRLLAQLSHNLHRFGFFAKTMISLRNRVPFLAKMAERLLGISAKWPIPQPHEVSFHQRQARFPAHAPRGKSSPGQASEPIGEVVLLIDTFTDNFAPQQAEDAIAVLSQAGYRVITTRTTEQTPDSDRPLCCGRTHIANGMVDQARIEAKRMLSVLLPHVEAGRWIVGLEPACLLAVRDDYRFLGLGPDADKVASQSILFEEFIVKEMAAKRFELDLKPIDTNEQPLLVHGHCHQKAVGAMKSMRKVLKLIPALKFEFVDASCCGMAGSFGIEKEHADIALEMAEQSLLPTLRASEQARILANGFSCRHQIEAGVNRPAVHVATLLREALA